MAEIRTPLLRLAPGETFTAGGIYATGSGGYAALGAMHAGASAVEAVRIACHIDAWSAEPVYSITHDGDATWR